MKRNISKDRRLTDRGRSPKEKSSFTINVKGGEKNIGMERKKRGMKTGEAGTSMRRAVSKTSMPRGILFKD
jgi:hypothetical protein